MRSREAFVPLFDFTALEEKLFFASLPSCSGRKSNTGRLMLGGKGGVFQKIYGEFLQSGAQRCSSMTSQDWERGGCPSSKEVCAEQGFFFSLFIFFFGNIIVDL